MRLNNRTSLTAVAVSALLLASAPQAAEPQSSGPGANNGEAQLQKVKPREMIDVGIEHSEKAGKSESELVGPGRLPEEMKEEKGSNPRIRNVHDGAYDTPGTNPGAHTDPPE